MHATMNHLLEVILSTVLNSEADSFQLFKKLLYFHSSQTLPIVNIVCSNVTPFNYVQKKTFCLHLHNLRQEIYPESDQSIPDCHTPLH